ncbi:hypothetical protein DFH06DRAFT_1095762 [Mycena polygramma]|nr:hypothetical protein DFH06DRAFT_1095762 [Mycena polygramma]
MSSARLLNSRLVGAALLLTCAGYFAFRSQWAPPDNIVISAPWPERTAPVQITVTLRAPQATVTVTTQVPVPKEEVGEDSVPLNGPPTRAFQDNLRPELQYITTWATGGFTNDVMSYMNLIYLSTLTQRVPIIPFFFPGHIAMGHSTEIPVIDFGEVFDLPRLQKSIGTRVVEWWQVKDRNSASVDPLGCWNIWQAVGQHHEAPHYAMGLVEKLKLDVSYTIAPSWIKLFRDSPEEQHMTFTSLMALTFPEQRNLNLRTPSQSPILKLSLPPDEHLMCFDNLYWLSNVEPHEMEHDYSPAWRLVGQYLRWNPRVEDLAQQYVRRAFGLTAADAIPPYITIHVRHGDFKDWCRRPVDECFAPLSAFARRVEEVKAELLQTKGIAVQHVVMTSDEKDRAWWNVVAQYGWVGVDHSTTVEKHGMWYPLFIDAAIQSGGVGLVGTDFSTVSLIAGNRIKAWHGGVVRMVKWGKPGADDH